MTIQRQTQLSPLDNVSGESLDRLTFLVVGAQRCGTTWADEALREHPEVYLPQQKQTYFFDRAYDKGVAWYAENFADVQPEHKAIGEVASGYCLPNAIPRMAKHCSHVKIMMAMRNPVDRAYSYYLSRRNLEHNEWTTFEEAVEIDAGMLARGRYIEQIELLYEHYDPENVLLLFYDDLVADDRAYLRSMYRFIGVDEMFESTQCGQRRHAGNVAEMRYRLERIGLRPFIKSMKRSALGNLLRRGYQRFLARPDYRNKMKPETRWQLIEYYAPFNERLAALTKRDLSRWNE